MTQQVQRLVDVLGRQEWLQPVDTVLSKAVTGAFKAAGPSGGKIKDFLNGVWLGHPLHPMLTDIPTGAWTTACVMDAMEMMTGDETFGVGADGAIAVGLAGAVGSALSGLADWQYLVGGPRRVGLVHGLLNVGAVLLYSASLGLRRTRARGAGQVTSAAGYSLILVSSYLGGDLAYKDLAQVNHANTEGMPRRFVKVLPEDSLAEGKLTKVDARGTPVVLLKRGEQIYALAETCSHMGGPLAEGELRDDAVICPWHGSCFAFEDGHILNGPATFTQPCFETRVRDGQIEVRLAR